MQSIKSNDLNDRDLTIIKELVECQKLEVKNKAEELIVQKRSLEMQHELAKTSIDAQLQANAKNSDTKIALNNSKYKFYAFITFLISAVIIVSLVLEKDDIVKEIIKAIVMIGCGYIAGVGRTRLLQNTKQNDQD